MAAQTALTPDAAVDAYDDPRMAMCFSLVSLGGVPMWGNDPKRTAKTSPDQFDAFPAVSAVKGAAADVVDECGFPRIFWICSHDPQ